MKGIINWQGQHSVPGCKVSSRLPAPLSFVRTHKNNPPGSFILKRLKWIFNLCLCCFIASCGGGDGQNSSPDPDSSDPAISVPPTTKLSGHFIDSAISGIEYRTPSSSGITDREGTFYYSEGERVEFRLGSIIFGETIAKPLLTPLDLVDAISIENAHAVNIAQLLLTLDEDQQPHNGIVIPPTTAASFTDLSIDFQQTEASYYTDPALMQILNAVGLDTLVDRKQVLNHLAITLIESGQPDKACPEQPCAFFKEIWSEQFPGSGFNGLPGNAGKTGNKENHLLMGVRADGFGYVGTRLLLVMNSFDISYLDARFVRIPRDKTTNGIPAVSSTPSLVGSGKVADISQDQISFDLTLDPDVGADGIPDYHAIVVWIDSNLDGEKNGNERAWFSNSHITVVDEYAHAIAATFLAGTIVGELLTTGPTTFLQAFLVPQPNAIDGIVPTMRPFSVDPDAGDLDHNVGISMDKNPLMIWDYAFSKESALSHAVVASTPFSESLRADIMENEEIQNQLALAACDSSNVEFTVKHNLKFPTDNAGNIVDLDTNLFYTLGGTTLQGKVTASVQCIAGLVHFDGIQFDGEVIDLYDFDYPISPVELPHYAAMVQALHGTILKVGQVYGINAKIEQTLDESFTSDLHIECGVDTGAGYRQCPIDNNCDSGAPPTFNLPVGDQVAVDVFCNCGEDQSIVTIVSGGVTSIESCDGLFGHEFLMREPGDGVKVSVSKEWTTPQFGDQTDYESKNLCSTINVRPTAANYPPTWKLVVENKATLSADIVCPPYSGTLPLADCITTYRAGHINIGAFVLDSWEGTGSFLYSGSEINTIPSSNTNHYYAAVFEGGINNQNLSSSTFNSVVTQEVEMLRICPHNTHLE